MPKKGEEKEGAAREDDKGEAEDGRDKSAVHLRKDLEELRRQLSVKHQKYLDLSAPLPGYGHASGRTEKDKERHAVPRVAQRYRRELKAIVGDLVQSQREMQGSQQEAQSLQDSLTQQRRLNRDLMQALGLAQPGSDGSPNASPAWDRAASAGLGLIQQQLEKDQQLREREDELRKLREKLEQLGGKPLPDLPTAAESGSSYPGDGIERSMALDSGVNAGPSGSVGATKVDSEERRWNAGRSMVVGEVPRGARTQTGGSTPGSAVQAVAVRGTELVVTAQAVSVEPVRAQPAGDDVRAVVAEPVREAAPAAAAVVPAGATTVPVAAMAVTVPRPAEPVRAVAATGVRAEPVRAEPVRAEPVTAQAVAVAVPAAAVMPEGSPNHVAQAQPTQWGAHPGAGNAMPPAGIPDDRDPGGVVFSSLPHLATHQDTEEFNPSMWIALRNANGYGADVDVSTAQSAARFLLSRLQSSVINKRQQMQRGYTQFPPGMQPAGYGMQPVHGHNGFLSFGFAQ